MMELVWLVAAFVAGSLTGTLTGLMPGIHVNVVAALMVSLAPALKQAGVSPLNIAVFIVTVAVVHAFCDVIPSLFLGVPAADVFALLPGHKLVSEGLGIEAMRLSLFGSWWGLILSVGVSAGFVLLKQSGLDILGLADTMLKPVMLLVLLAISVLLIVNEKRRLWALTVFLASGFLGLLVFATPLVPNGSDVAFSGLFPALSGLFGVSGLLLSLAEKTSSMPAQDPDPASDISMSAYGRPVLEGATGGMVVGLLPGLGAANVATVFEIAKRWRGATSTPQPVAMRQYLVTTSAINTADTFFGIAALYFLEKARSGASIAIEHLIPKVTVAEVAVMAGAMALAAWVALRGISASGLHVARILSRLHYRASSLAVLMLVVSLVLLTTGFWGSLILVAATLLGMIAPLAGIHRAQAMGLFLVPVILFYSGLQAPVVTALGLQAINLPTVPLAPGSVGIAVGLSLIAAAGSYAMAKKALP